jgi:DNA-binding IclR family transcriptional regulator
MPIARPTMGFILFSGGDLTFDPIPSTWSEERLRYRVLRLIYERSDGSYARSVTATEVGTELDLAYEDVFRVMDYLAERGYLFRLDDDSRVCITPRGMRYVEQTAGRRQTVRN